MGDPFLLLKPHLLGNHSIGYTKQLITVAGEKSVIASYEGNGDLTKATQTITELFAYVPVNGVVQSENTLDAGDY